MPAAGRSVAPSLLIARARHAGPRWLLVAAGLALAPVLAVVAQTVTVATADATLRRAVQSLPVGERSLVVSYNGILEPAELARLDGVVARELPRLAGGGLRRQMVFREIAAPAGQTFVLGATDELAGAVRLTGGRLPDSCTPTRCEVLALRAPGMRPVPDLGRDLGLVVTGTGERVDPLLLGGTFAPQATTPVLVADGVRDAAALASLSLFGRTFGWVEALDVDRLRALGVPGWVRESADVSDDLWRDGKGLVLTSPDDVLRREDARARVGAGRLAVLGGAAGVLLLGTAVVGGAALRRDHEAFVGALRRRGAGRRTLATLVTGEVLGAAVAGCALGLATGSGIAALLAARAGLPVGPTVGASVLAALPSSLALVPVAALLLGLTLALPAAPGGRAPAAVWRAVEAVVLACVAVTLLLAARGAVGAAAGDTDDPLLPALPVLVLVAGGLTLARLWPAVPLLLQRVLPVRAVALRLGVAAAGGRPLRPVATAALLTAAVGAAVFAGAYRSTLERGAADQAAFAVPGDARLAVGRSLQRPLDQVSPAAFAAAAPGSQVDPVVRATASLRVASQEADPVQLVGLRPGALERVPRWAAVTGGGDPAALDRLLRVAGVPAGTALPAGRVLEIATPGTRAVLALTAVVRADDGRERGLALAVVPGRTPAQAGLRAELPVLEDAAGRAVPLRLVSITLRQPVDEATRRQHALGEASRDLATPTGRLALGAVTVDGSGVPSPWTGWAAKGLRAAPAGATAVLDYALTQGALVVDGRAGGSPEPDLPVVVDPATAATAPGGRVSLVLGQASVAARIVGTLPRFPTVQGRFAVTDLDALSRLVDRGDPLAGRPAEVWLTARGGSGTDGTALAGALAAPAFAGLDVRLRSGVEEALRSDPVSRGAVDLLMAGALVTLLVGAAALVLLVVADRTDDAGQAYAWEADGVPPRTLRASLWWRAVVVAAPAVPAGALVGLALGAATARLVAVTASAGTPTPPLAAATGSPAAAAAIAAGLVLALAVAAVVAGTSLREPLPVRGRGVAR